MVRFQFDYHGLKRVTKTIVFMGDGMCSFSVFGSWFGFRCLPLWKMDWSHVLGLSASHNLCWKMRFGVPSVLPWGNSCCISLKSMGFGISMLVWMGRCLLQVVHSYYVGSDDWTIQISKISICIFGIAIGAFPSTSCHLWACKRVHLWACKRCTAVGPCSLGFQHWIQSKWIERATFLSVGFIRRPSIDMHC